MKRVFFILSLMAVLMETLHVSFAIHYCQGEFAAARLSFTGETATCGMEKGFSGYFPQKEYASPCCEDHIFQCHTDNKYIPSVNVKDKIIRYHSLIFYSTIPGLAIAELTCLLNNTELHPPGKQSDSFAAVSLPQICVFRK